MIQVSTCRPARWIHCLGPRGRWQPWTMQYRYQGRRWQHLSQWRYPPKRQPSHLGWQQFCWQRCLHNEKKQSAFAFGHIGNAMANNKNGKIVLVKPGTLVPRATIVMAVIESLMRLIQPKCAAMSPMTAVKRPMKAMDVTNAGHPLPLSVIAAWNKLKNVKASCLFRNVSCRNQFAYRGLAQ